MDKSSLPCFDLRLSTTRYYMYTDYFLVTFKFSLVSQNEVQSYLYYCFCQRDCKC